MRDRVPGFVTRKREPDHRGPKQLVGGKDLAETIDLLNNVCNEKGAKSLKLRQCIMYTKYNLSVNKKDDINRLILCFTRSVTRGRPLPPVDSWPARRPALPVKVSSHGYPTDQNG